MCFATCTVSEAHFRWAPIFSSIFAHMRSLCVRRRYLPAGSPCSVRAGGTQNTVMTIRRMNLACSSSQQSIIEMLF